MYQLITHATCPPGEFFIIIQYKNGVETIYQDLGATADGFHKFGPWPQIGLVADELVAFRKSNGIAGANTALAIEQIDAFTCFRIGNNPQWCASTDRAYIHMGTASQSSGGCCGYKTP